MYVYIYIYIHRATRIRQGPGAGISRANREACNLICARVPVLG